MVFLKFNNLVVLIYDNYKKEINIEYCPTEEMIADYFTKPLQGALFRRFRNAVLGMSDSEFLQYKDEYYMDKALKQGKEGVTWFDSPVLHPSYTFLSIRWLQRSVLE